jgi:hypothetical protein
MDTHGGGANGTASAVMISLTSCGVKRGDKRRSLEVRSCFPALLRWVVAWPPATCCQLALAMDALTLGQCFTILTISVVVRGCAIPIAWHIVEATRPGAWRPH